MMTVLIRKEDTLNSDYPCCISVIRGQRVNQVGLSCGIGGESFLMAQRSSVVYEIPLAGLFDTARGYGSLDAVIEESGRCQTLELGDWELDVTFGDGSGAVVVLPVSADEAYVLAMGGIAARDRYASTAAWV